jgi:hypothetical protein
VFRETYTQADVVSGTASGVGIAVADVLTLHRGARAIRINRAADGSLAVELPGEKVRVDTAGHIEIALRTTL